MRAFIPAEPTMQAARLARGDIHVWRMPYRRASGRDPFRQLLAHYLRCAPAEVDFVDGPHGRPHLAGPAQLDFNWSHSEGCACIAIARDLPVLGIDIEAPRPRPRALDLARRFFRHDEAAQLAALPPAQIQPAFLRLWTAKEAVLKALGHGLSFGLDRVAFRLHGGETQAVAFDPRAGSMKHWQLQRRDGAHGFVCLAWRDDARRVSWFERPGS